MLCISEKNVSRDSSYISNAYDPTPNISSANSTNRFTIEKQRSGIIHHSQFISYI
jgi:hypothetical protein